MPRELVRSVSHRMQRSIERTVGRRPSQFVHRSLIATTSCTTSYDGSCHRYSPIVRDSATTRRDRSRYATAAGDRSKHCRSVALWPIRNQPYDPEIVRSGVTVALPRRASARECPTVISIFSRGLIRIVQSLLFCALYSPALLFIE